MVWNGVDGSFDGGAERGFTLESDGRVVPGVYWTPADGEPTALVLLGHGGGSDKKADYIELIAHGLCGLGIASIAIDGPGHGDRPGADQWQYGDDGVFRKRWESDGGTAGVIADWKAALDFLEAEVGANATGYLGLSMGTMMGLPLCVAEDRIKVAVFGLMGVYGPNRKDLANAAPELSIPARFIVQWDDERIPRDSCLELFDALGTAKKTLHANPGKHAAVPAFEIEDAVHYLATQLAKL